MSFLKKLAGAAVGFATGGIGGAIGGFMSSDAKKRYAPTAAQPQVINYPWAMPSGELPTAPGVYSGEVDPIAQFDSEMGRRTAQFQEGMDMLLAKQKRAISAELAGRGVLRSSELATGLGDLYGQAYTTQAQFMADLESKRAGLAQQLTGQQMQYQADIYGRQLGAAQNQQAQYLNFLLGQQQAGADIYQWQVQNQQSQMNNAANFGTLLGKGLGNLGGIFGGRPRPTSQTTVSTTPAYTPAFSIY